jgi:hypothetical protein
MPPPGQPAPTHRTTQPTFHQPPLDLGRHHAYREHRCLQAPHTALPATQAKTTGRADLHHGHAHVVVGHEKGQPLQGRPHPHSPATSLNQPNTLIQNDA